MAVLLGSVKKFNKSELNSLIWDSFELINKAINFCDKFAESEEYKNLNNDEKNSFLKKWKKLIKLRSDLRKTLI